MNTNPDLKHHPTSNNIQQPSDYNEESVDFDKTPNEPNKRKRLEQEVLERTAELKDSRSLLQATLDSSPEMIQVFKAVRNNQGLIVDFIWVLNNASAEAVYGDVIGKSLLENNPGVIQEGIVERFITVIDTGIPLQYEQRYVHEQFNGWFYQSVVKLDDGVATSTLDITHRKETEERLRALEAGQQQEIFKVTLATQEEERKRVSESLHNGLGQLLYGIMISLSNLSYDAAIADPEVYKKHKQYTDKLLAQAIHESRRISHELMPSVLEDFGLSAAIEDVCKQFSNSVQINCSINIGNNKFDRYLELAIFRITQELMTNIIKHSKATTALLNIKKQGNRINILVRDNGVGINNADESQQRGIGLASIRNKVSLLHGVINIQSKPGNGTSISIDIPTTDQH
ncbi:PAS domain-containing sensor histidine kinase [Mucilaginibacter auburnensis]|uniref:Oxygen sensor histidine kinase NreB n=1 Tax=Mucilaginibacter auburnensis TaxID=1457233 RepID=A0A2H9VML3_9SPHI|nr:PAS domain-containing sensor histidine kinase [Mucilaginibacter auburnensis]PJJ79555.1 histidine kinase [Mucilaginibacter auburnensis]